ncbi:MAG TPA: metallophosphoesterase family protein [Gaiellaceae bacterium]|nr:metallophosphoesterase family protein [Gaiellaceae bacterium]
MRVAALYDVHGNLPALEAVLDELGEHSDLIVVGGDFLAGPQPAETLERLRELGNRARFIRGNVERELVEPSPPRPAGPPPGVIDELKAKLTQEQIEFAFGLPQQEVLEIDGLGRTLFCHATPRNDEEIVTPASSEHRFREVLAGVDADVVVVGHTHMQHDRVVGGIRFVNAGSVGMPYEDAPGAYWALLGPDVEFRRTEYEAVEYEDFEFPQATRAEATEYFESLVE